MLTNIANSLSNKNQINNLYILVGDTLNGKSTLMRLIENLFGEYATDIDLYEDYQRCFINKKIVTIHEQHILEYNYIKILVKLKLKSFMMCNTIPAFDNPKIKNMIRIINFPNKFCENPIKMNEKQIDVRISKKLKECVNEFFHLLLRYI